MFCVKLLCSALGVQTKQEVVVVVVVVFKEHHNNNTLLDVLYFLGAKER